MAAAVGKGFRAGSPARLLRYHKCNADNELPASCCKSCGTPLAKTRPCPGCRELNDPGARFCDHCGMTMA
ncbi:MAG: zinc ribbon domain-containing protein [Planctomycetes bacterium]|nr:zinc ribbon domain-containing protein [Planctomycetota bacterium]